ncbi:pentatricopeptide repeat-containing protein At2g22410, mitochondrial-like [Phragmites australis]|uniref:pentatricopeptide repeat-containing protein At2g22410, mitochondrial-like n=1 Tax=Phragmites australis TaxID=29695 RepID=UPI002D77FC70|nr:pentatricopeptide repeat-containing protein At2g22410, mitochondrial-like [Phragmites australis]XP_062194786.1 pentatricopeptide repeat-containing protein At2g22410, mitochondrial-like [Phragmites australis]XP_062194787.1 pentatricopeptide repeat-containing protein At2g22410, mitochondrial-like [Phragmites australis]
MLMPVVASHHLPSLQKLLHQCRSIQQLNQLHAHLLVQGSSALAAVASYCALSGDAVHGGLCYARYLFDGIPDPDRFTCNNLIRAYSGSSCPQEALCLHRGLLRRGTLPNEFTLPSVLKACTRSQMWEHALAVHGVVVKLGFAQQVYVGNALLHSYALAGSLGDSRRFFDEMVNRNVVSWNSMIGGYAQRGEAREACTLFREMRRQGFLTDEFTLVSFLLACSQEGNLEFGRLVHCHMLVSGFRVDLILANALVDMYGKCGDLWMSRRCFDMMPLRNVVLWTSMLCAQAKHGSVEAARDWFDQMPERNIVSWNAMISCYVQAARFREALDLYNSMRSQGLTPDEVTLVAVLSACGQSGDLTFGKMIHRCIRESFHNPSVTLVNSLLDMYTKCGQVDTAIGLFSEMNNKNVISWNVIIGGLAIHGRAQDTIVLFRSMVRNSFLPDKITFVGLLSACSHGGLLEAGQYYFEAMRRVYNVKHEVEHYACMVDLLGRRGHLEKAVDLIKDMPMKPDVVVWGALLGACRIHGNVDIGRQVIKQLLELEGISGGLFVLISNLLYETHHWEDMKKLRKLMKERGLKKDMGVSSIELYNNIHEFGVEDIKHESSKEIYAAVDQLSRHLVSLHVLAVQQEELFEG